MTKLIRPHQHRITLRVTQEMYEALQEIDKYTTYTLNGFLRQAIIEKLRDVDNQLGLAVAASEMNDGQLPWVHKVIERMRAEQEKWRQDPDFVPF